MKRISVCAAALLLLTSGAGTPAVAGEPEWKVPDIETLPDDKFGRMIRLGKDIIDQTYKHIGPEAADPAKRFAGNNLACKTCHLESGAKKFGATFVGTFADFPQYRPREHAIGTIEDRVNGCMERSMNGRRMPVESAEMKAIVSYMKFMSTGVPVGTKLEGRGDKKIKLPQRAADPAAGKVVYAEVCVACHGEDGQGKRIGVVGDGQGYEFPPLWGPDSYNTGAGMARVIKAANFIRYNMPLGVTHDEPLLTDEQAYDVAAFINSQPRPEKSNLEADFPARKNKPADAAFPPHVYGTAEQHKYARLPG